MTKQKKPMLIARLYVEGPRYSGSECAHIGVNFSYIEGVDDRGEPEFDPFGYDDFPLKKIFIYSQCDQSSLLGDGARHYGWEMTIPKMKLMHAEPLLKEGKKLLRRIDKLQDKFGDIQCYKDYLRYFFDAAKVDKITLQEKHGWRLFDIKDLDHLFEQCDKIACESLGVTKNAA